MAATALFGQHRACARYDARDAERDMQPYYYNEESGVSRGNDDAADDGRVTGHATNPSGWLRRLWGIDEPQQVIFVCCHHKEFRAWRAC